MKITQAIRHRINDLVKETNETEFRKSCGIALQQILSQNDFSANDLVAICKGLDVELVEFFADSSFELKAFN